MRDLIEALTIFLKYGDPPWPTHCEHDVLHVCIDPALVSVPDRDRLAELGFNAGNKESEHAGGFYSFRYGSC